MFAMSILLLFLSSVDLLLFGSIMCAMSILLLFLSSVDLHVVWGNVDIHVLLAMVHLAWP
jgi:hypothetical protein